MSKRDPDSVGSPIDQLSNKDLSLAGKQDAKNDGPHCSSTHNLASFTPSHPTRDSLEPSLSASVGPGNSPLETTHCPSQQIMSCSRPHVSDKDKQNQSNSPDCPVAAKVPKKGILKTKDTSRNHVADAPLRFDEMNILATLHPVGKDYGHMKIDEPKTPFERASLAQEHDSHPDLVDADGAAVDLDPNELANKLQGVRRRCSVSEGSEEGSEGGKMSSDSEDNLSPNEQEKKKKFQESRKKHYNEFSRIQEARKLMQQDDDDEDDEK